MTKTFASIFLAASLAVTSITMPSQARADSNDVAKAIAALVAIGIIAKAVDDRKDRKRAQRQHQDHAYKNPGPIRRDAPRRYGRKTIPTSCVFRLETAERGVRNVVGPRCLSRKAPHVSLPDACQVTAWTRYGWRPAFVRGCLKKRGYRFI